MTRAFPGLSHWFGIHPWDIPNLTVPELNAYLQALEQIARDQRKR